MWVGRSFFHKALKMGVDIGENKILCELQPAMINWPGEEKCFLWIFGTIKHAWIFGTIKHA